MKLAITIWQERIAPVFDVSREAMLLTVRNGHVIDRLSASIEAPAARDRVDRLATLEIDTLICGAISAPVRVALAARGVKVFGFVAGDTDAIIDAFLNGRLADPTWTMPGCCGRHRHRRMRCLLRAAAGTGVNEP